MSTKVKAWGSIGILSTMMSFVMVGVLGWSGVGTLKAYDTAVDVDFVKNEMRTMNQSLVEVLAMQHEFNTEVVKHELRIQYCEKTIDKCEEYMK